jgi:hypothetical protein
MSLTAAHAAIRGIWSMSALHRCRHSCVSLTLISGICRSAYAAALSQMHSLLQRLLLRQ